MASHLLGVIYAVAFEADNASICYLAPLMQHQLHLLVNLTQQAEGLTAADHMQSNSCILLCIRYFTRVQSTHRLGPLPNKSHVSSPVFGILALTICPYHQTSHLFINPCGHHAKHALCMQQYRLQPLQLSCMEDCLWTSSCCFSP